MNKKSKYNSVLLKYYLKMQTILLLCTLSVAACHVILQQKGGPYGNDTLNAVGLITIGNRSIYRQYRVEGQWLIDILHVATHSNEIWNKNGTCYWPEVDNSDNKICSCGKRLRDLDTMESKYTATWKPRPGEEYLQKYFYTFDECSLEKNASIDTCDNWSIDKCVHISCVNNKLGICEDKLGGLEFVKEGRIFGSIDHVKSCIGNGLGLFCTSPVYPKVPVIRITSMNLLGIIFSRCISRLYFNNEELIILSMKGRVTCFTDNQNRVQFDGKRCDVIYPSFKYSCSNRLMQKLDDLVDCETRDYIISCNDNDVSIVDV